VFFPSGMVSPLDALPGLFYNRSFFCGRPARVPVIWSPPYSHELFFLFSALQDTVDCRWRACMAIWSFSPLSGRRCPSRRLFFAQVKFVTRIWRGSLVFFFSVQREFHLPFLWQRGQADPRSPMAIPDSSTPRVPAPCSDIA